ncbi:MAG: hypothetical protein ACODAU_03525 [Myxococcota bacterium]
MRVTAAVLASLSLLAAAPVHAEEAPAHPRVTVVVAGDADEALRTHAATVHEKVRAHADLRAPEDPDLVGALRGEPPPEEEDGLSDARRARRRLGWGEARDVSVLERIARFTAAHLLLVVRRAPSGPEVEAFDAAAGAFYEGTLALPADADTLARFVVPRARAARARALQEPPAAGPLEETTAAAPPSPGEDGTPKDEEPAEDEEKRWIAQYWPYLVAGALLAGTVTYFVVRDGGGDDPPPPVLRFRIGGDR